MRESLYVYFVQFVQSESNGETMIKNTFITLLYKNGFILCKMSFHLPFSRSFFLFASQPHILLCLLYRFVVFGLLQKICEVMTVISREWGRNRFTDPDSGVLVGSGVRFLVGSGFRCFGLIRIKVFWLDPKSGVMVGSGFSCVGRIRIQVFWSYPESGVLIGSGL